MTQPESQADDTAPEPAADGVRSRRTLLAAAAAAAATWTLGTLDPEPVAAAGTMLYGTSNDASNATTLLTSSSPQTTFVMQNSNGGVAIQLTSSRQALLAVTSASGTGSTTGAWIMNSAVTNGSGVIASVQDGTGLLGYSGPAWNSVALYDMVLPDTGVLGYAPDGTGVYAKSDTGAALRVNGKAIFSRAKRIVIAEGRSSVTVSMAGVTSSSYVLATLQSRRPGYYVSSVVCATNQFTIYLNKALTTKTAVGYLVIN